MFAGNYTRLAARVMCVGWWGTTNRARPIVSVTAMPITNPTPCIMIRRISSYGKNRLIMFEIRSKRAEQFDIYFFRYAYAVLAA